MEEIVVYASSTVTNYDLGVLISVAMMIIGGILVFMKGKID